MRTVTPFIAVLSPFGQLDGQTTIYALSWPAGDLDFEQPLMVQGIFLQVGSAPPVLLRPGIDYALQDQGIVALASSYAPGDTLLWSGSGAYYLLSAAVTLTNQYATDPVLSDLVAAFNQWFDPSANLDLFYDNVWNVLTAVGFGLDVWGRIVGVPRTINVTPPPDYLGFKEAEPGSYPFNQQPFYNGPVQGTLFTLTDQSYRVLILTKALANICSFTAPAVNALLAFMFKGRGSCYVLDLGGMAIEYVFNFPLESWESSVLLQANLMPRPAGVAVTISNP